MGGQSTVAEESNLLISLAILSFLSAPTLRVCADEAPSLADLARGVRLATVVPGCGGGDYLARFVALDGGVALRLEVPGGDTFTRAVPWLATIDEPLARTALADRMGALGVLIDGLVLEHQLAEPPPPPPTRAPARRRPPRMAPAIVAPPTAPPPPPFDPGPSPPSEPPPILALAPATVAAVPPPRVRVTPPPPNPLDVWGGVHLGGRWRTPDLLIPQAWLLAGLGPARLAVGWQPGIRWAVDGRSLSTQTLSLAAGGAVPLRTAPDWRLRLPIGLLGELTRVERTDPAGDRHTLFQGGLEAGLSLSLKFNEFLWLTADGLGRWLPLGTLRIEDGPVVPFNRAGAEIGLGIVVAPAW